MGFGAGSGIKQSAPRSRQITTTKPHHSIFRDCMLFLTPNQQCQSTEGTCNQNKETKLNCNYLVAQPVNCHHPAPTIRMGGDATKINITK